MLYSAVAYEGDSDNDNDDSFHKNSSIENDSGEGIHSDLTSIKEDDDSKPKSLMPCRGDGSGGIETNSGNHKK